MKIYLVRHGQTEWNQTHRFQGWVDVELDKIGLMQSKMLTNYFKNVPLDYIYTSDLLRALKTAINIHLTKDCRMKLCHGFRELDVGDWEGKTWEEIEVQYKDDLKEAEEKLVGLIISGGESLASFQKRVLSTFMPLIEKKYNNILIVTHGGVIRVLLCHLLGYNLDERDKVKIDNGSITILNVNKHHHIHVVEKNITSHLS